DPAFLIKTRIDDTSRRRVWLAVGAQRNEGQFCLLGMYCRVILRRSDTVNSAENPHEPRRRFIVRHAGWNGSIPSRPADEILLRSSAGCAFSRNLKHIRETIQHRHEKVTTMHVGNA